MYIFVIFRLGVIDTIDVYLSGMFFSLGFVVLCYAKYIVF